MLIPQFVKLILKLRIVIFKKRNILSKLSITGIGSWDFVARCIPRFILFLALILFNYGKVCG